MDVTHAILFAKTIDISRVTADYSSAKFEFEIIKIATGGYSPCRKIVLLKIILRIISRISYLHT